MGERIIEGHSLKTLERIESYPVVLRLQDTTDIVYKFEIVEGIGYLDAKTSGLKVHTVLAASEDGLPLGILHQEVLSRPFSELGKVKDRRKKKIEEKESYKWINGFRKHSEDISEDKIQVTIGDRESDIYDLFTIERKKNQHFLVRASQNRLLEHVDKKMFNAMSMAPAKGILNVEISRRKGQSSRIAELTVKYEKLIVKEPKNTPKEIKSVELNVILVEELSPPGGIEPVKWILITSLEINDINDAIRYVRWYSYRWLIERFHYVLKSGCKVEDLQLEEVNRLKRALSTFSIVAYKILALTYQSRKEPELPCDAVFEGIEWKVLYVLFHKDAKIPKKVPKIKDAILWLAELGGFLGRKGDGPPGVKTIWRGYIKLQNALEPFLLFNSLGISSLNELINDIR